MKKLENILSEIKKAYRNREKYNNAYNAAHENLVTLMRSAGDPLHYDDAPAECVEKIHAAEQAAQRRRKIS